jgi:hypothetical protein
MNLQRATLSLLLLVSLSALSLAQTTAEMLGMVTDPSNASIAAAKLTARNLATNLTYTTTSGDNGSFRIPLLPPGEYELTVEKSGFGKYVRKPITLQLNQKAELTIAMQVAGSTEIISVTTEAPLINTTNAEVGINIDAKRISELPLSPNRNMLSIALQAPGVSQLSSGNSTFAAGGVAFSVNGMRTRSNNFMIDGADSNNSSVTGLVQEINNPDLVGEFRLITNQFLPEYGRSAGSVVNIITKSGSNAYHGTAYWNYNSNVLNSRTNLDERTFPKAPWRVENQFGGTMGGKIIKDRTFFFGSLLRWTDRRFASGTAITGAPTEAGRQALQSIAAGRPQITALLNNLPAAQSPSGQSFNVTADGRTISIPYGTLSGAAPNKQDTWQWSGRIDHRLTEKHNLMGRVMYDDRVSISGQAVPPGLTTLAPARRQAYNMTLTSTLSPTTYNEFRANLQRASSASNASDPKAITIPNIEVAQMGLTGFNAAASRTAIGLAVNLPQASVTNNYQIANNIGIIRNNHSFKFGGDIRRVEQFQDFNPTLRGRLNYETVQQLVDDTPAVQSINVILPGLRNWQFYRYYDFFFFAQDEWRIKPNFTLTYGVRYETPGNPFQWLADENSRIVAQNNNNPNFRIDQFPKRDTNNWAPRVGFNYRFGKFGGPLGMLMGDGKTVLRGGYSRTYDFAFNNIALNIYSAFPFTFVSQRNANTPGGFQFVDAIRAGGPAPLPANLLTVPRTIVGADFRSPFAEQFSIRIDRELTQSVAFNVGYISTKGTALFQTVDGNPAVPGSNGAVRVDNNRGTIRLRANTGSSIYHSLQTSLEKRYSKGFSMSAHYTWSSFIDDQSEIFNSSVAGEVAVAQDSFNRRADRGRSTYDRPHRLSFNGIWDLPVFREQKGWIGSALGGWQVGGFVTFQSGAPFSVLAGIDPGRRLSGIDALVGNSIRANVNTNLDLASMNVAEIRAAGTYANGVFSLFSLPTATNPLGNAGRNILRADGINNVDMVVTKKFRLPFEGHSLGFRTEFYNLGNTRDFGIPEARANNPGFANQWNTDGGARRIVMQLRYQF